MRNMFCKHLIFYLDSKLTPTPCPSSRNELGPTDSCSSRRRGRGSSRTAPGGSTRRKSTPFARSTDSMRTTPGRPKYRSGLKGSIGEGPNQTNYSDRSSVRILGIRILSNFRIFEQFSLNKVKQTKKIQKIRKFQILNIF